jgi:microsomal dipeptidase-like Zn-dependent dipeptidase
MPNLPYIADLHAHPTMKPFRQQPEANIWEAIPESPYCQADNLPNLAQNLGTTAKVSQTNLKKGAKGNVRLIVNAFYMPERRMFQLRQLTDLLTKDCKEVNLGACISGFDRDIILGYFREQKENLPVNYFLELEKEYQYLFDQQGPSAHGNLKLAGSYAEAKEWLDADPSNIACLTSLEGLHSLAHFANYEYLEIPFREVDDAKSMEYLHFLETYDRNIRRVKAWGDGRHAPLYATCAHFFWNMICGHARTAGGTMRTFGINQNFEINEGFTLLGKEVVRRLLSRENGRRVLIDVKHMSPEARIDFYNMWEQEYRQQGDHVPIICSHAAVNGIGALSDRENRHDNDREYEQEYFNTWSINLTDEDLLRIHQSQGLIGFIMQTDRIAGGIPKRLIEQAEISDDQRRDEYIRMFMSNILHAIRVCNDRSAWDLICLGTDYDGLVNPFKYYADYSEFGLLADHLQQFFERPIPNPHINLSVSDIRELMFGYSPLELAEKIMYRNMEQFLERYYSDEYLLGTPARPEMA